MNYYDLLNTKWQRKSLPELTLQRRYNERGDVWDHQPHDCLLNRLFRRRSKKTSKLRVTGLCVGNSPVTDEFPAQRLVTRKMLPFDDVIMRYPPRSKYQSGSRHRRHYRWGPIDRGRCSTVLSWILKVKARSGWRWVHGSSACLKAISDFIPVSVPLTNNVITRIHDTWSTLRHTKLSHQQCIPSARTLAQYTCFQ